MKPVTYPHQRKLDDFDAQYGIKEDDLPIKIQDQIRAWFKAYKSHRHTNGAQDESLLFESMKLQKELERWFNRYYDEDPEAEKEERKYDLAKADSKSDKILMELWNEDYRVLTEAQLKAKKYGDWAGFLWQTKHFKLKKRADKKLDLIAK